MNTLQQPSSAGRMNSCLVAALCLMSSLATAPSLSQDEAQPALRGPVETKGAEMNSRPSQKEAQSAGQSSNAPTSPPYSYSDPPVPVTGTPATGAAPIAGSARRSTHRIRPVQITDPAKIRPGDNLSKRFLAVRIRIKNESDMPYMVDGNNAVANYGSSNAAVSPERRIVKANNNARLTFEEAGVLALITLGSAGLAGPIAYEVLTKTPDMNVNRYGYHEVRRRVEGSRFSTRVVLPGEESEGYVFVPAAAGMPESFALPVITYPDSKPVTTITVELPKSPRNM